MIHEAVDINGTAVLCNCHKVRGARKLAELHPRVKIEIVTRTHGEYHSAILTPQELLCRLAGTVDGSAIVQYVKGVIL